MSFLLDWLWSALARLGLWRKDATVLCLGLDNAGKTTLLHKLKTGKVGRFVPTQRPGCEAVDVGSVRIKCWDLGGHRAAREVWTDYFVLADAIIFMVDLTDRPRLAEAAESLRGLVEQRDTPLERCVLLVLGNKSDRPDHMDMAEVQAALGLGGAVAGRFRSVGVFAVSLYTGRGYSEALQWLEDQL